MIAGLYLGELFRLVLVDLHDNKDVHIFEGQNIDKLRKAYTLDSSFLSMVEEYVSIMRSRALLHADLI
jgi:hexokinase